MLCSTSNTPFILSVSRRYYLRWYHTALMMRIFIEARPNRAQAKPSQALFINTRRRVYLLRKRVVPCSTSNTPFNLSVSRRYNGTCVVSLGLISYGADDVYLY